VHQLLGDAHANQVSQKQEGAQNVKLFEVAKAHYVQSRTMLLHRILRKVEAAGDSGVVVTLSVHVPGPVSHAWYLFKTTGRLLCVSPVVHPVVCMHGAVLLPALAAAGLMDTSKPSTAVSAGANLCFRRLGVWHCPETRST
jgi:hypothetical protein